MPMTSQSIVDTITNAGSHTRDSRRSSNDWESRTNGQWYKRDYYQLQTPTLAATNAERGLHVMGHIFTGCYQLCFNDTWQREKNIERVLVLGTGSGVSVRDTLKLRVVDISEGRLDSCLDSIVTLLTEASNENANVLIVDRDMRTFVPTVVAAYLISLGWLVDAAVQRVQGIYKTSFSPYHVSCLQRWEQELQTRRTEITSIARSRSNSVPLPPPVSFASTIVGGSVPAISALSVINPMYYAAPVTSLLPPLTPLAPIVAGPAISAVSLVNPLWSTVATTGPLISAQSVINPYWSSAVVATPIVQPIMTETIATSVINPRFHEVVSTRHVSNPVVHERHERHMSAEFSGRRVVNTPSLPPPAANWHSRSVPSAATDRFDASNPLARHPLTPQIGVGASERTFERQVTGDRTVGSNAALADAVESAAFNTARSLQRRPHEYIPSPEFHAVRDVTTFG